MQARNQAEAEWLYRNGYPSQAQLDEWAALPDDQLKRAAASGNVAALAVYAERVAKGGNVMGGLVMSKVATERGSLYAYHVLSDILMMPSPMQDQYDAMAYLRVAHMLGDNKAALELYRKFPERNMVEYRMADRRASGLYITFVRGAAAHAKAIGVTGGFDAGNIGLGGFRSLDGRSVRSGFGVFRKQPARRDRCRSSRSGVVLSGAIAAAWRPFGP